MNYGKCGHEKCLCTVNGDDFCSDYCQMEGEATEVEVLEHECRCGHTACAG
jgi:hypothetical protein